MNNAEIQKNMDMEYRHDLLLEDKDTWQLLLLVMVIATFFLVGVWYFIKEMVVLWM